VRRELVICTFGTAFKIPADASTKSALTHPTNVLVAHGWPTDPVARISAGQDAYSGRRRVLTTYPSLVRRHGPYVVATCEEPGRRGLKTPKAMVH